MSVTIRDCDTCQDFGARQCAICERDRLRQHCADLEAGLSVDHYLNNLRQELMAPLDDLELALEALEIMLEHRAAFARRLEQLEAEAIEQVFAYEQILVEPASAGDSL